MSHEKPEMANPELWLSLPKRRPRPRKRASIRQEKTLKKPSQKPAPRSKILQTRLAAISKLLQKPRGGVLRLYSSIAAVNKPRKRKYGLVTYGFVKIADLARRGLALQLQTNSSVYEAIRALVSALNANLCGFSSDAISILQVRAR